MKIQANQNYRLEVFEGVLFIEVDLEEIHVETHLSASGKSVILATTGVAVPVPGTPCKLNLTLHRRL